MTIDTQKLLSLFDTAAQAHGWASDQGTRAQAQTALANYQRTRGDLEQALDAQAAEIARLREALWVVAEHNALHFGESHNTVIQARALLSRYSSDRPAEVRCNHCGWLGADADLVRDVAADEPDDGAADVCPQCKRIGDLQDIGQSAASAESECSCCGGTGEVDYPGSTCPACGGTGKEAPVAQEPVARDWPSIQSAIDEYLDGYELIGEPGDHTPTEFEKFLLADAIAGLLDDEKFLGLFAAPVAAQVQPTGYEEAGSFIWDGDEWRMAAAKYGEDPDVVTLYKRVNAQDEPQQSGISGELPSAQDREDAERYRWATALDDNSETLHSIVLSYGGDQAKINERVDVYRACDARAAKGE